MHFLSLKQDTDYAKATSSSSSNSSITGMTAKPRKISVQVENLLHDVNDDAADVDDDEKDTTGKVFKLVPHFGNRATLVISTNQNAPTPASADDDDQKGAKIEWPKFRKQNLAVSNY